MSLQVERHSGEISAGRLAMPGAVCRRAGFLKDKGKP
jgi:hypothetical protein